MAGEQIYGRGNKIYSCRNKYMVVGTNLWFWNKFMIRKIK
jgi:hypothetical protein